MRDASETPEDALSKPRASRVEGPGSARLPLQENGEGHQPLVLVVEDNAEMRAYLREQLAARYRVREAEDGAEGLAVAREEAPDLVLSDVMMPGMDGIALLEELKTNERLSRIPVILLTARAAEEDRVEGLAEGADDYIVKPFSTPELLAGWTG